MDSTALCDFCRGAHHQDVTLILQIVEGQEGATEYIRSCIGHRKDAMQTCLTTPLSDPVISFIDLRKEDRHWVRLEDMAAVHLGAKQIAAPDDRSRFKVGAGAEVLCHVCELSATQMEARFNFWIFTGGTNSGECIHCCRWHVGEALGLCAATRLVKARVVCMDLREKESRHVTLEHLNATRLLIHCF